MTPTSLAARVAVATLVATSASALAGAPASAAGCPSARGVTLVVDFNQLGPQNEQRCVPSGGGSTAAELLDGNGFPLTYVQRQPGFVCRVSGLPRQDPCVNTPPADAYWALWWSDGSTGRWSYATTSAGSLEIPDGGYVALAWDQVDGDPTPSLTPSRHAAGATAGRASAAPDAGPSSTAEDPAGLPTWVATAGIALLFAAAGGTALRRRRRGTGGP